MHRYPLYIDGTSTEPSTGEWFETYDPYQGKPWAEVAQGTADDVDRAVQAAHRAHVRAVGRADRQPPRRTAAQGRGSDRGERAPARREAPDAPCLVVLLVLVFERGHDVLSLDGDAMTSASPER